MPGLPADAEVEIVRWEVSGGGSSTVDLALPAIAGLLTMDALQSMEIEMAGVEQAVTTRSSMSTETTPGACGSPQA